MVEQRHSSPSSVALDRAMFVTRNSHPISFLQAQTIKVLQVMRLNHFLIEETDDLSSNMFPSRLLVVHDTSGSCEDNVSKLTRRQELDNPLLHIYETDVVSRGDDTSLVEAVNRVSEKSTGSSRRNIPAIQLDDNLA
jgi:hypothetical protein